MNLEQLRAIVWLRWRLRVNQVRRSGTLNAVLLVLVAVGAVFLAALLFLSAFLVGRVALRTVADVVILYVWDGVVVAFLFVWLTGLLTELQRSEVFGLEKFLHLPVSPAGAFLINYLSSLVNFTLLLFLPIMIGLSLGLALARGPLLLLLLPLVAALVLAVTAVTYQFQGWLASLMVNKRRRRTVIALVTVGFVLLCQVPNLVNVVRPWKRGREDDGLARLTAQQKELDRAFTSGKMSIQEYTQRTDRAKRDYEVERREHEHQTLQQIEHAAGIINLCLPPGWMPLGALGAAQGNALPALLGTLGLALLGGGSLWRSYRTTVKLYTGQFTSGKKRAAAAAAPVRIREDKVYLLERQIPWLSEQAAAIALASLRSLLRAPEAKMALLTPIIMVVVFGGVLLRGGAALPEAMRPLVAFGAMGGMVLSMVQLVGNQFGIDRNGFRVFVLSPAPRSLVLLGKNLAVAPLVFGLGLGAAVLMEVFYPLRFDHFLALLVQFISMYLLVCLLGNFLSILAPMRIAAASLKPANPRMVPVLMHVAFVFLLPVLWGVTVLPLAVDLALTALGWNQGLPIALALSLLECAAMIYAYRLTIRWQGSILYDFEQKILDTIATKAE